MSVMVYSPCYGQTSTIAAHVASLRAQTVPVARIVTVEDGGDPESWRLAEFLGVEVVRDHGGENLGLAASCNTALAHCDTKFLAKVDSDVELAPFWLERCLTHFKKPIIDGVCGRLIETGQDVPARWRAVFMKQHWGAQQTAPQFLYGCDCIFRVDRLRAVDGWRAEYRKNYEDVNLSMRLAVTAYEPGAFARHLLKVRWPDVLNQSWQWSHDPLDIGYGSIEEVTRHIAVNYAAAVEACAFCNLDSEPALMYPCWLAFWWRCLKDLEHVQRLGNGDSGTQWHVRKFIADYAANEPGLPTELRWRIRRDIGFTPSSAPSGNEIYLTELRRHTMPTDPAMIWCLEQSIKALGENS